jgi:hypothetical protein
MIFFQEEKIVYPRDIVLVKEQNRLYQVLSYYDRDSGKLLLQFDYFDLFDFVNEMLNEGHTVTIKNK